ncbi:facilitated trehalose transporter Tret1-like [Spodoptera litura]|uniref:Facilitated trehalose transporter Tret1-like n=1 Tax=Spodoptera litura TaxID=69820 RepID=A0A9J7EWM1_SPOLT|nr:facilitated trehalose transporter Tret1-like [Spodoptera litura]
MTKILEILTPKLTGRAHIYRQVLATFASSLLSLAGGITFGFTAVLLPQLKTDTNFPYDEVYDSWIASISPLAMMMGSLFSGWMSDGVGRRMGQLILIVPFTLGWFIMGVANNNAVMLIGRFITGMCTGAVRANSMVYIGELSDPKHRAVALFWPSAAIHIGVLISHLIGKYTYWKTSCLLFTVPNILCFLILLFLKESPLWLLSKGKIDEGIQSFKEFRGEGESSEKELTSAIEKNKEKAEETTTFRDILDIVFSKPFAKSIATIVLLFIAVQWCGINTISFYAETIFEKTFGGDIDAFMLTIVTDSIRIIAAISICMFARMIPRKITFVVCSITTTVVLVGLILCLYLNPSGLVWVSVTCMVIYIGMASALTSISWSFVAEIFPAKVRGLGSGMSSAISFVLLFISVKVTPEIMYKFGEQVMYASFASVTLFSSIFLSFILPETNGRSLQDIEDSLYKKKPAENKDINLATLENAAK